MAGGVKVSAVSRVREGSKEPAFSERPAWAGVGGGWQPLHGSQKESGFSFEWHDFVAKTSMDWSRTFHPGSVEICLNLAGAACLQSPGREIHLSPMSVGLYRQHATGLTATRAAGDRHQFLTVELASKFLSRCFRGDEAGLHPLVRGALGEVDAEAVVEPLRLTSEHQQLINSLRHPPVFASAQPVWYEGKALELMASFLFTAPPEKEFFCQRQKRLSQERVDRVIAILKRDIAEPPPLDVLGREVGCSSFYLSRIFSQEMGKTISQYLRQLRMEKAAELLKSGRMNVTQVAMEIGYSSSSHFSVAFHETYGCCPGLYPLPMSGRPKARG